MSKKKVAKLVIKMSEIRVRDEVTMREFTNGTGTGAHRDRRKDSRRENNAKRWIKESGQDGRSSYVA